MTDEIQRFTTPEGRLINAALFEKDKFSEESIPAYKLELAMEDGDAIADLEEALAAAALEKWGAGADEDYFAGNIRSPLLDGNKLAARREEKGKAGDAYKDMVVIRPHTKFNRHGQDAPGGIQVYGPDVSTIEPANQQAIYPGCYGVAAVTISTYLTISGDKALMFYLSAFQKTRDGEVLAAAADHSTAFKPVGRAEGDGAKRRTRKS